MADLNVTMPSDLKTGSTGGTVSYAYCSGLRELKDVIETLDTGDSRTTELENQTLSLDELTFSDGKLLNKTYVVRTNSAGRNITGRPNDDNKVSFVIEVEIIKWVNEIDYTTRQTYYEANNYDLYTRYCTSGIWSEWQTADSDKYDAAGAHLGLVKSGGDVNISDGIITIKDGTITNDKIGNVSADKIVGGTIDGSQVDIININMSNASGSIGGSSIEDGSITADKLSGDISDLINDANNNAADAIDKANSAQSAANLAKMSADGKNTVYYQPTVPTTAKSNDIWFNTAKDNQMSIYDGAKWVVEQFGSEAIGNNAISTDKIAAEVNTKLDTAFENAENALGDALDAIESANQANTVIGNWCYENDTTYINGGNIYTGSITAKQIAANSITSNEIMAGTITAKEMMAGTITAESGILADACIKEANIADAAITSAKIANATIGTAHISDLSVTNAKLADLAVTNAKIADATIENAKIKNLDAAKITTGYLSADRIEAGSLSINQFNTETREMIDDAIETSSEALGTATANGERLDWVSTEVETNTMSITAINGEISSLISKTTTVETELNAVKDDVVTMTGNVTTLTENYNETKDTVDSHAQTIGQHTESITNLTKTDTELSESITEVSDKQTSLEQNLEGFKTTVSNTYATQTQLENVDGKFTNYSTTEQMNSAITQKANEITTTVSSTYATKTSVSDVDKKADDAQSSADSANAAAKEAKDAADDAKKDVETLESRVSTAETSISQNSEAIALSATKKEVTETLGGYYTKEESDANLTVKANEITSAVSQTYATKTEVETVDGKFEDYSTTEEMNTAIEQTAQNISLAVSKTYATQTQLNNVDGKFANYSTTTDMNSAINLKANEITQSVGQTYATKQQVTDVDGKFSNYSTTEQMNSAINQKAGEISSRVDGIETQVEDDGKNITNLTTRMSSAEQKITDDAIVSTVRSSTEYTNDLGKKVSTGEVISSINQTAESIKIQASKIELTGAVTFNTFDASLQNQITSLEDAVEQGVDHIDVMFYLSSSDEELLGGEWSKTRPEWIDGYYYWQKIITTYVDETSSESSPVCITGNSGQGVKSVTPQYTLSKSNSALVGSEVWQSTTPEWSKGYYLWIRNVVVYENPSKTVTTEPYCDSAWDALNDLKVSTNNLIRNSNFSNNLQYWSGTENYTYTLSEDVDNPYIYITSGNSLEGSFHTDSDGNFVHESDTEYSISFMAKSDKEGTILTASNGENEMIIEATLSTEWTLYTATYTSISVNTLNFIIGTVNSSFYLTNVYLVHGSVIGDWQKSLEDINDKITSVNQNLSDTEQALQNQISQTKDDILQDVSDNYLTKEEGSNISTQLNQFIVNTNGAFMEFEGAQENAQGQLDEISKHIRFIDGKIYLGVENDNSETTYLELVISNESVSYMRGTDEVAHFTDQSLLVQKTLQIGNFAFIPRGNGSLDFKKVGDD